MVCTGWWGRGIVLRPFFLSEPWNAGTADQPGQNIDQPDKGDGDYDDLGYPPERLGEWQELDDIPDHPEDDEAYQEGYEEFNYGSLLWQMPPTLTRADKRNQLVTYSKTSSQTSPLLGGGSYFTNMVLHEFSRTILKPDRPSPLCLPIRHVCGMSP
jgi:hypothetical protein